MSTTTRKLFQQVFVHTAAVARTKLVVTQSTRVATATAVTTIIKRRLTTTFPCHHGNIMQQPPQQDNKMCWSCQSINKPTALFCQECSVIQPIPTSLNFFQLLQVGSGENKDEASFDIDLKKLKKQFLILQQKAHPDSFSQAPKRQHEYAQLQSSVINKAYNTLKNPLNRAQYILKQHGIQVNEGDSLSDAELLMEVMEFREELDQVTNEKELIPFKERNDEKYQATVNQLSNAFKQGDLKRAQDLAVELQYWNSIKIAIHEWGHH